MYSEMFETFLTVFEDSLNEYKILGSHFPSLSLREGIGWLCSDIEMCKI